LGIPYQAIGIGLGFLLGIWALIEADTFRGRIFIVGMMAGIFFLPVVWRSAASRFVSFIGWMIFAIGCFIFLKLHGVGVP
jgi:hypothetical protein